MLPWPVTATSPLVRPTSPAEASETMRDWVRGIRLFMLNHFAAEFIAAQPYYSVNAPPEGMPFTTCDGAVLRQHDIDLRWLCTWMEELKSLIIMVDTEGIGLAGDDGYALRHYLASALFEGARLVLAVQLYGAAYFSGGFYDSPLFYFNWMVVPPARLVAEHPAWQKAHSS